MVAERARASTPYLEAAVNVAGWLSTLERQIISGSAWQSNDGPNALVLTGVSDRAVGIGFFFLRLNHVTRNPAYLGKARRAADYIASTQHRSDAASELVARSLLAPWRSPVADVEQGIRRKSHANEPRYSQDILRESAGERHAQLP